MFSHAILLAQVDSTVAKSLYLVAFALICIVLPFVIGHYASKSLRMPDYGWKIGTILMTLLLAGTVVARSWDSEKGRFRIPLGVDLKGGVILIYEVAEEDAGAPTAAPTTEGDETAPDDSAGALDQQQFEMNRLVAALARRINPSGTKEIVIRPYGQRQVEIIIPEVDAREVETIKKRISTAGVLQFRIVANNRRHADVIAAAREMALDPVRKRASIVRDEEGTPIGLWARVAREDAESDPDQPFKLSVARDIVRDASTGDILDIPTSVMQTEERDEIDALQQFLDQRGIKEIDVLMATNDLYDVTGAHLGAVSKGQDDLLNPSINFNLKGEGVDRFASLTKDFSPSDDGFKHQLGILLDNYLLSAPNIQEMIVGRGRITGRFTEQEVDFMVNILSAGSLPVILNPTPISESIIDPLLGRATIKQSWWAIQISMALVLLFMLFYYRFAGIVAAFALLANLLFIVAMIILIKAALTLPGLAGLVLTVGMSVDANVLIFERIREELARGASLRMAIRNGFARATTTIVDANVTTLITAIVLYAIGTDQIRGFAVTLILGILMSMYTAIFCSRVIFDIAERNRWITNLSMAQILGHTEIDFLGKRWLAGTASVVLIVIGIVGLYFRGADIFDIDFRGGTSVNFVLKEPMETQAVRDKLRPAFAELGAQYTLTAMNSGGRTLNKDFKVDSSIREVEALQQTIQNVFRGENGSSQLATYGLNFGDMKEVDIRAPQAAGVESSTEQAATETAADDAQKATSETTEAAKNEDAAKDQAAKDDAKKDDAKQENDGEAPAEKAPAAEEKPAEEKPAEEKPAADNPDSPSEAPATPEAPATTEPPAEPAAPADAPSTPETPPAEAGDTEAPADAAPADQDSSRFRPELRNLLARADNIGLLLAQATEAADDQPATEPTAEATDAPAATQPAATQPAATQPAATQAAAAADDAAPAESPAPTTQPAAAAETEPATPAATEPPATETPATEEPATPSAPVDITQIEVQLSFAHGINHDTLTDRLSTAITELNIPVSYFEVTNPEYTGGSNAFDQWTLRIAATKAQTTELLDYLQKQFADTPVWSASNSIGSQVADRMQNKATQALLTSLFLIVGYIWFRFQRVMFGLAAVVALVHDVLITLGAIAISYWLAGALGFLLIEEFKISLPIVAALLTIIGYSLNDTIIVFDRIREVRGKSPELTVSMINTSINQTLSRTLLTSLTTLLVVVILYFIGGEGIHGFAFALVVGIIVGTYSSIFVASPILLWMAGPSKPRRKAAA